MEILYTVASPGGACGFISTQSVDVGAPMHNSFVVAMFVYHIWLLTHSQHMYITTQPQAATSVPVLLCSVCCSYMYTDNTSSKICCVHTHFCFSY